jgi:hypothetical protein
MAKVLVEVDIHAGYWNLLEIDWRGHIIVQRLDYLGIPFRCSLCRRTGHLRKECHSALGMSDSEDSLEDQSKDLYMDVADSQELGDYAAMRVEDTSGNSVATFVGKLKSLCPSLYFSLSAWERDHLDSTFMPERLPSSVNDSGTSSETDTMRTDL